jgi:hypothetical protein
MTVLSLGEIDGLTGVRRPVSLRTEDVSAVWIQNNGGAEGPVMVLMRSGEEVALETIPGQVTPLYNRIRGAL